MIKNNRLKLIEFALLCIAFHAIIIFKKLGVWMFLFLWSAAAYCIVIDKYKISLIGNHFGDGTRLI